MGALGGICEGISIRTAPIPDLKRVMALIDRLRPLAVELFLTLAGEIYVLLWSLCG